MASLIFAAGVFGYDRVQKSRTKRRAKKEEMAARFSELEKDNAERMARLQSQGFGHDEERQGEKFVRRSSSSAESVKSRRSSLAEEGPPPPGYEEAMKGRLRKG